MYIKDMLYDEYDNITVFNLLAFICSCFDGKQERTCVAKWSNLPREKMDEILNTYSSLIECIHKAVKNEYNILECDKNFVIDEINKVCSKDSSMLNLFLILLQVELAIGDFSNCYHNNPRYNYNQDIFAELEPLNSNHEKVKIKIYPHIKTIWSAKTTISNTTFNFNAKFNYYNIIKNSDESYFSVKYYYWDSNELADSILSSNTLKIAVSPICNNALVDMVEDEDNNIIVNGLSNEEYVNNKVIDNFTQLFKENFNIIFFPEVIGSKKLIEKFQAIMLNSPTQQSFVILPTYYDNNINKAVLLGPSGLELFVQNKNSPFILKGKDSIKKPEKIEIDNTIKVLLIKGVGSIAIPICADLLDNGYEDTINRIAPASIVLCPSFSPGINLFENVLNQGYAFGKLSIWCNTCSVANMKDINNYDIDVLGIGLIQPPTKRNSNNNLIRLMRRCAGKCKNVCYFDILFNIDTNLINYNHIIT